VQCHGPGPARQALAASGPGGDRDGGLPMHWHCATGTHSGWQCPSLSPGGHDDPPDSDSPSITGMSCLIAPLAVHCSDSDSESRRDSELASEYYY
jgi:hypothetical protein